MSDITPERVEAAYQTALAALLAERTPGGYWVGELSTSALSTAVAVSALSLVQQKTQRHGAHDALIAGGLRWLAENQNADGGWGDTVKSLSNISTTMLCRAAFHMTQRPPHPGPPPRGGRGHLTPSPLVGEGGGGGGEYATTLHRAEKWLAERYGSTPEQLAEAVRARYGKDRTFSVPILMTSALAGLVDWKEVPSLPFELACFPQSWYAVLQLRVVSYALPALIAIGQAVFHHRRPRNPLTWMARRAAIGPSLRKLEQIQPSNGGFLEATPLTSFVTLGLASSGRANHVVVRKAVEFLVQSARPDGSWPIDTNLSTWVTTLAVNALAMAGDLERLDRREAVRDWLLRQQYKERHPYTGAEPGAWAWTDLPGGVPDGDDTPGAILALEHLTSGGPECEELWDAEVWLSRLQNRDGGWPTFCRGWGALPFDRSGCDLTAHVLRAFAIFRKKYEHALAHGPWAVDQGLGKGWIEVNTRPPHSLDDTLLSLLNDSISRGITYLARQQRPDGSWLPLWFGNQHAPDDINPTYGTARVLAAYRDLQMMDCEQARRGVAWLVANQNDDGGWGGIRGTPSSVEETSLAVEVLLDAGTEARRAANRGVGWLVESVEAGGLHHPTPIGFYFAKLWYFEKLYPIIFAVAALGRARGLAFNPGID